MNKQKQSAITVTVCIFGFLFCFGAAVIDNFFSSKSGDSPVVVSPTQDGPAIISCLELQRYLNRRNPKLKLKEDGICGPATMAALDAEVCTQYAIETWPVKARMEAK